MTRLHEAITNDETDTAIALINEGADLNALCDMFTPLHLAILYGRSTIALKLINEGVDLNALTTDGYTPLHWAIICEKTEIAFILIEKEKNLEKLNGHYTPLHRAILHGRTEIALKLIEKGANLDTPRYGLTPLYRAIIHSNTEIARALILKGANINPQTTDKKETPLHLAARTAPVSKELIKLLLNASPDMTLKDSKGVSVREAIQNSPQAKEAYDEYCAELSKMATFSADILESKGIPLEVSIHIVKFAFSQHGLYFSTKAQSDAKAHMVTGASGRILEKRKNERAKNVAQSGPQNESRTAPSEGSSQLRRSARIRAMIKKPLK